MEAFKCDGCQQLFETSERRQSWAGSYKFEPGRNVAVVVKIEGYGSKAPDFCIGCFQTALRDAADTRHQTLHEFSQ